MDNQPAVRPEVLAVVKNIATNGRLFCVMLFVIALAAFVEGYGIMFAKIAVLATVPVGMACLTDQMQHGRLRQGLTYGVVYLLPGVLALVLFFAIR